MRKDLRNLTSPYEESLALMGITPRAVGWPNLEHLAMRYEVLLSAVDFASYDSSRRLRLLDLGCGPGFLLDWLSTNRLLDRVDYTGVDATEVTMRHARARWPQHRFEIRDVRERPFASGTFDFAILCGVLSARLGNSYEEMRDLVAETLRAVWPSVTIGLSFNVMSKHVDWERDDLFHWPLDDIMRFCKANLSRHVALRLDYGPWETAVIVTREPVRATTTAPPQWTVKPT